MFDEYYIDWFSLLLWFAGGFCDRDGDVTVAVIDHRRASVLYI